MVIECPSIKIVEKNNNELKDGIVRVSYQIYINKMKDFFVVGD